MGLERRKKSGRLIGGSRLVVDGEPIYSVLKFIPDIKKERKLDEFIDGEEIPTPTPTPIPTLETCRIETQFYEDIITQDNFKLVWDICNITPTPTPTPTPIPISCDCIQVTYQLIGEEPVTVNVIKEPESYNGKNVYSFEVNEETNIIYWRNDFEGDINWVVENVDGEGPFYQANLESDTFCPFGIYTIQEGSIFESFVVSECGLTPTPTPTPIPISCDECIRVSFTYNGVDYEYDVPKSDEIVNGRNKYAFDPDAPVFIEIFWNETYWLIIIQGVALDNIVYTNSADVLCPTFDNWVFDGGYEVENLVTTLCYPTI
jgi:hypothetical protein